MLIVSTNTIRRRTIFVVMTNNSAALIVKIITKMTIITFLFREQAMFAVDLILGWDLVAEDEYDTATCTATD